jgi:hypothetical protein
MRRERIALMGVTALLFAAAALGLAQAGGEPEGGPRTMSGTWRLRSIDQPGTLVLNRNGGFALVREFRGRPARLVTGTWRVDATDLLLESRRPDNPDRPLPGRGQRIDETRWRLVADGVDTLVLIDPDGAPIVLDRPGRE